MFWCPCAGRCCVIIGPNGAFSLDMHKHNTAHVLSWPFECEMFFAEVASGQQNRIKYSTGREQHSEKTTSTKTYVKQIKWKRVARGMAVDWPDGPVRFGLVRCDCGKWL